MMNNMINKFKRTLSIAISIIFSIALISTANNNAYASFDFYKIFYQQMLDEVNKYRVESGLPALKLDETLCDMAEVRAKEISEVFSHTRPDGSSSSTIFNQFNVNKSYSGENIAYHYKKSVLAVMDAWLDSQAHCANIFSPDYEYLGVGLYEEDGYYYWAQVFSADVKSADIFSAEDNALGDINNDGSIDSFDASLVLSMYSQLSSNSEVEFTEEQLKAADVNGDGRIDSADASGILKYYSMASMNLIPEF